MTWYAELAQYVTSVEADKGLTIKRLYFHVPNRAYAQLVRDIVNSHKYELTYHNGSYEDFSVVVYSDTVVVFLFGTDKNPHKTFDVDSALSITKGWIKKGREELGEANEPEDSPDTDKKPEGSGTGAWETAVWLIAAIVAAILVYLFVLRKKK